MLFFDIHLANPLGISLAFSLVPSANPMRTVLDFFLGIHSSLRNGLTFFAEIHSAILTGDMLVIYLEIS